jgi:hypothetical protein
MGGSDSSFAIFDGNGLPHPYKEGVSRVNKAFRFGVVNGGYASRLAWTALAQRAEELGYTTLLLPDALETPLAMFTALAVAATWRGGRYNRMSKRSQKRGNAAAIIVGVLFLSIMIAGITVWERKLAGTIYGGVPGLNWATICALLVLLAVVIIFWRVLAAHPQNK